MAGGAPQQTISCSQLAIISIISTVLSMLPPLSTITMSALTIYLEPPPIPPGGLPKFTDSNRTIAATFSPARSTDLAIWIAPRDQLTNVRNDGAEDLGALSGKVQLGGKRAFGKGVDEDKWGKKGKGTFEQDRTVWVGQVTGTESGLNQVSRGSGRKGLRRCFGIGDGCSWQERRLWRTRLLSRRGMEGSL